MSYRKRDIGHWNQGKRCKGTRKAYEREFVDKEIDEQIAELDPNYRTRHISKGNPNYIARLEHSIAWYERVIKEAKEREERHGWRSSFRHWCQDSLIKAKKKLAELKAKS